jgi:hypothetical protein
MAPPLLQRYRKYNELRCYLQFTAAAQADTILTLLETRRMGNLEA